ncbi:MAG TPA: aspartate kinase, partial [Flavisolibacter sp.]|nr:aspartate kinase [Flavisolibacter sp.]
QAIVSVVGNEIASNAGNLKKVFDSLDNINVRMVSYGGSAHNISILVSAEQKNQVLKQLNKGVFGL